MATITLKDENGSTLAEAPLDATGLGKYVKSLVALRSLQDLALMKDELLADVAGEVRQIDFALEQDVAVGKASELSLQAGASCVVGVHGAGTPLFGETALQAGVIVPNGMTYTSLQLEAHLKAGLATGVPAGGARLSFGFEAGTGVGYAFHLPFDTAGAMPTFGAALKDTVGRAVLAADADDLKTLPIGAFMSLTGSGRLSLHGAATMSSSVNVLATPGLPLLGKVTVPASANVSVHAAWEASGAFELRVGRPAAGQITLSYHRSRGRAFTIGAKATAGIQARLGDSDLLQALMRTLSPDPQADLLALVDAGLSDLQIADLQRAIAASLDRSLTVSAQMQLSSIRGDEALFGYELTLDALDAKGGEAVGQALHQALHGDLTALDALADADGSGVRVARVAVGRLRTRKVTWRLNLFGILNSGSLREQISTGVMTFDPINGALNVADRIAGKRIRVDARPLESDPDRLRRLLFESLVVTAAYGASQALPARVTLSAEHTYLEQHGRTPRAVMQDHYRAILALGLCDRAERDARIGASEAGGQEFGASTFALHAKFDAAACDALFLDVHGQPWPEARYERLARNAFLALIPADDPERSFRRFLLDNDRLWREAAERPLDLGRLLPPHIRDHALRVEIVRGDLLTIRWWAATMAKAGPALLEVRRFIAGRDAAALVDDDRFKEKREALEKALAAIVANTQARFDDPWDVLALDFAASGADAASAVIVSTTLAASYDEESALEAVVPAPARTARAMDRARAISAAAAGEDRPVFTPAQIALLERHVVNLHRGALSTEGVFSSTVDQVTRIFTEHIPEAIAARPAGAGPLHVVFSAHGGLIEEVVGLRPALARRRFWLLNGIYPVYFVWETGLWDAILGVLFGAQRRGASRAPVTDGLLEEASRPAGQRIWAEMKTNARNVVKVNGGGTLVAKLSRDLWNAHADDVAFHAVGHSAGAIFHAHFLPALVNQPTAAGVPKISVRSLHLLAPAITTTSFTETLKPLVGAGKPITALTMYTMTDALEQADTTMRPYGKSLLYLVSRAFEDARPAGILGLHESLLRDAPLIRFFGLAGREKVADIVFSQTASTLPLHAQSQSTTHGGFDFDRATMTSVVRRITRVPDTQTVVEFFEDPIDAHDRVAVPGSGGRAAGAANRGAKTVKKTTVKKDVKKAVKRAVKQASAGRAEAGRRRPAVVSAAAGPKKKWTVLVWMAGDNNLEAFGDLDLAEMKRVGSSADVDVVTQFDSMRDSRTRRYHIGRDTTLDQDLVEELGETNTGDPAVATDFFTWGIKRYPSERVLAVIWNHGAGIDDTDIYARVVQPADSGRATARPAGARVAAAPGGGLVRGLARGASDAAGMRGPRGPAATGARRGVGALTASDPAARGQLHRAAASRHRRALFSTTVDRAVTDRAIAFDDSARDFLDNLELQKVLVDVTRATGRPIDILGFDACLMNMVEVAYQVRSTAGLVVGSQEIEPGNGWPYDRVLAALTAASGQPARALGASIVAEFVGSYAVERVTQSLLDLARVEAAAEAVDDLATALIKAIKRAEDFTAVTKALNVTQRFETPDFVDLGHFCRELSKKTSTAALKRAAKAAIESLEGDEGLVAFEKHSVAADGTSAFVGAYGVAIYFPRGPVSPVYSKLDFAKDTRWGRFLDAYHKG